MSSHKQESKGKATSSNGKPSPTPATAEDHDRLCEQVERALKGSKK